MRPTTRFPTTTAWMWITRKADLILVGVSRSGKTPTCLYMALHYGVSAANYPLTDDDLDKLELPKRLVPIESLFGLTIDPQRLAQIREQRRAGSRYATLKQCRWELEQADRLMRHAGISQPQHHACVDRGDFQQDFRPLRYRADHVLSAGPPGVFADR
jgi:hypothetical protein